MHTGLYIIEMREASPVYYRTAVDANQVLRFRREDKSSF